MRGVVRWRVVAVLITSCISITTAQESRSAASQRWTELAQKVTELSNQRRFADALPLAEEAHQIARRTFGVDDQRYGKSALSLAKLHNAGRRFLQAAPLYREALRVMLKVSDRESESVLWVRTDIVYLSMDIDKLAYASYTKGDYPEAARLFEIVVALRQDYGAETRLVASGINNVASALLLHGDHARAEELFKRALSDRERALGPTHPDVASTLNGLADLYRRDSRHAEAEPLFLRALSILQKAPPDDTLGATLNNLALLYQEQGRYLDAEQQYLRAKGVMEQALGPADPEVAVSLHNLGTIAAAQGKHSDAIARYTAALEIRRSARGANHPESANSLNSLANVYGDLGDYAAAETYYETALKIRLAALDPQHLDVADSYNNLAAVYVNQGRYEEGERLHKRALAIQEQKLRPDHPTLAGTFNNLAFLYHAQGRNEEATRLYLRALEIRERSLKPDHPLIASSLSNLAALYIEDKKHDPAERSLTRALAITENTFGRAHPQSAIGLQNLAGLSSERGRPAEAERRYLDALKRFEATYDSNHPHVGTTLWNLATLLYHEKRPADAGKYFERALGNTTAQLQRAFEYMTERERLAFADTVSREFPGFFSFSLTFGREHPALVGQMYDALLFRKLMVAASATATRAKIAAGGDETATQLWNALTDTKRNLFRLASSPRADRVSWSDELSKVEQEANRLERELTKRSSAFANTRKTATPKWQEVRGRLGPREAAVEFVRFPFHDGKTWTGAIHYAALILTPASSVAPTMVSLGDARTLECGPLNEYSLRVEELLRQQRGVPCPPIDDRSPVALTPTFYQAFWKPLELALTGVRRIYVSLDGVLNQVPLGVVADDTGTLLLEKDVRVVLSTRDLLREPTATSDRSAVLIGNPEFDVDGAAHVASVRRFGTTRGADTPAGDHPPEGGLKGPPWERLPGAGKELDQVSRILRQQNWTVAIHQGKDAVVEAVKAVRAPRLLHLATHGEFAAAPAEVRRKTFTLSSTAEGGQRAVWNDPMLRSGLFFTGANRYRAGLPPPQGADDGVLTAYEASQLHLDGTELVVLSACKTGLGQEREGEGVFGLRRAFQIAGAQAVLMTMWRVPDEDTQALMQSFYRMWLAGADKHDALRSAQQDLRQRIQKANGGRDDASRWGAFVLVGR